MVFTSTLRKVTSSNGPWPLHDAATSRQIERTALLSATSSPAACATASASASATDSLMERAGVAAARLALALTPHARRVQIWCGPGNNGGDGLVAARHLQAAGWAVQVQLLANAQQLPADAAQAMRGAQSAGVAIDIGLSAAPQPADCVIDALLGLGSNRAPCGDIATAIAAVNGAGVPTLSIDLPSGLHPDTGALLGDCAVHATATLSLLTLKPGCFTGSGRDHAGQLWLDTLGADAELLHAPSAWLSSRPPVLARQHASHKGSFGDVAVVGGSAGMTGAAWLAARAASAAGAGRVYCSLLDHDAPLLDPLHPELLGRRTWWLLPPAKLARTTVACGCGAGDGVRQALPPLLAHVPRLVLDADALNAIAGDSSLLAALRARSNRGLDTLLTPHPLEAARLLGIGTKAVQADRLQAAQALAYRCQATVLLKGSGTVVAAPSQAPNINPTGNGALATAGTGDVLAGWAAGLWAQQPAACARDIASAAAWRHGQAADDWLAKGHAGPLRASDLVEALSHRR